MVRYNGLSFAVISWRHQNRYSGPLTLQYSCFLFCSVLSLRCMSCSVAVSTGAETLILSDIVKTET